MFLLLLSPSLRRSLRWQFRQHNVSVLSGPISTQQGMRVHHSSTGGQYHHPHLSAFPRRGFVLSWVPVNLQIRLPRGLSSTCTKWVSETFIKRRNHERKWIRGAVTAVKNRSEQMGFEMPAERIQHLGWADGGKEIFSFCWCCKEWAESKRQIGARKMQLEGKRWSQCTVGRSVGWPVTIKSRAKMAQTIVMRFRLCTPVLSKLSRFLLSTFCKVDYYTLLSTCNEVTFSCKYLLSISLLCSQICR